MFRRFPAPIVDYKLGRRAARAGAFKKTLRQKLALRVARFFSVQHTKTGENEPNNYKTATKYNIWPLNRQNDL
jgi:hypothetical protein